MIEPKPKERIAAAVLMFDGAGDDLRVLLVERSPELRFFGGYLALPGGVRGPEDGSDDDTGDLAPLRRCALREIFEETGVLLEENLRRSLSTTERTRLREALLDGDGRAAVSVWATHLTLDAGLQEVEPLCRIRTPPFAPTRYDTQFYIAALPRDEEVEIWPGELVGADFHKPGEILAAWRRGEVRIVPPVLVLLDLLDTHRHDLGAFVRAADAVATGYAQGGLHRVRFSPGVLMACLRTPTLPPATTTNCCLVGHRRLWIIDPATPYPDEQDRLFDLLDALLREGDELAGILVTHHHPDHVGAVIATSNRYDLPVRGHQITLERLKPGYLAGEPLQDGDRIPLGTAPDGSDGWELQAVFTPGHDRGHLCFHENRYNALIAGDMLSTVSTIVIDPPEGHLATYLESLNKLGSLTIDTLYPAHGPAVPNGDKVVQRYVRHRAQREKALCAALHEGLTAIDDLLGKVYWDADPRLLPMARRSLLAGLQKLEEDGIARPKDDEHWKLVGV